MGGILNKRKEEKNLCSCENLSKPGIIIIKYFIKSIFYLKKSFYLMFYVLLLSSVRLKLHQSVPEWP
jgi:hypothetical protein